MGTQNSINSPANSIFAPPRTVHAEDDEFDSATMLSRWTKTNSAALESYDDHIRSAIYLQFAGSSSDVSFAEPYSNAGDFTVTAALSVNMTAASHNGLLMVADASEANYVFIQALYTTVPTFRTCKNVASSFSQVQSTNAPAGLGFFFFHIQRASNVWSFYYSYDGVFWTKFTTTVSLTFTVDHLVLKAGVAGGSVATQAAFYWIRRDWLTL